MAKTKPSIRLTVRSLQQVKDKGFQYVLIKSYAPDRRHDYIQLNHLILVPVVELPRESGEKEIFAPIDSEIILDWANSPDKDFIAYIEIPE
jgi:hypothetical protein